MMTERIDDPAVFCDLVSPCCVSKVFMADSALIIRVAAVSGAGRRNCRVRSRGVTRRREDPAILCDLFRSVFVGEEFMTYGALIVSAVARGGAGRRSCGMSGQRMRSGDSNISDAADFSIDIGA